jgi:hypothetical protein
MSAAVKGQTDTLQTALRRVHLRRLLAVITGLQTISNYCIERVLRCGRRGFACGAPAT